MALTARLVPSAEAMRMGLVTHVCPDKAAMNAYARNLACSIAKKSPIAVTGIKQIMLHAR